MCHENVLLIGDSIRMGYDKAVKKTLDGQTNVVFPPENREMPSRVLRCISEWKHDLMGKDEVDDLYALSATLPPEAHSDPVHYYTPTGTEIFANQVLSFVVPALGLSEIPEYQSAHWHLIASKIL